MKRFLTNKSVLSFIVLASLILANSLAFQNCSKVGFSKIDLKSEIDPLSRKGCDFAGTPVADGTATTAYLSSYVNFGETCSKEQRTCNNGVLSGSYSYASCFEPKAPPACTTPRPADSTVAKPCSLLGPTYSGSYTETTPYACPGATWILGSNKTNNSATACSRLCPQPKTPDSTMTKSCKDLLGASYSGTYTETTAFVCSNTTWAWTPGSPTNDANTVCKQTTCTTAKPGDLTAPKSCADLGPTYSGSYTEYTPYVCSGTAWILGSNKTNNSATACSRNCPQPKTPDSTTTKSCRDLLGANYEGNYNESTVYSCSSSTWAWTPAAPTNDSATSCKIRAGACGPKVATGSWDNEFSTNPTAWCDIGTPVNSTGTGRPNDPFRWNCQLPGGAPSPLCQAKLCTTIGLKAGFFPGDPMPAGSTALSIDPFTGFRTRVENSAGIKYELELGCLGCTPQTDAIGWADGQQIHNASDYSQWLKAFQDAITHRQLTPYISVTQGEHFSWYGSNDDGRYSLAGEEVVLALTQPDLYFVSVPTNSWYISGTIPSGSLRTEVRCIPTGK